MAGNPRPKRLDSYLPKLLQKGFKVAICEQVEDAAPGPGPGRSRRSSDHHSWNTEPSKKYLMKKRKQFFAGAKSRKKTVMGLAWVDISTGQFSIHEIKPEFIGDEIARISPAECLIPEHASLRASLSNGPKIPSKKRFANKILR